ncbi:carbohydrate ABC transporter permease [Caloramator australicus]|uniref:Maltose transport system permease protein malG n=1 Tax=Caloramator australicus RC3 TaxID=857293 RepID=I7K6N2_9CLOT|nr:carbohydrate ABC transporter permease [Caloramator australicus]CCJ33204.1 maltose transport system permease protein malG [Caloramator australicus RC3]
MKKINADKIVWLILLILSIFLVLFPIYIMFKYSISDRRSWITGGEYPVPWWPFKPTLEMYKYYLGDKRFWSNGWLSLKIALLTVSFSLILGTPAAYSLARFKFNGKAFLLFLILAIRFYPDISSVIPVSYIFNKSFLYNLPNEIKISLAHCLLSLPYIIFIAQGVFETIPVDLEEQALILGTSRFYAFLRIVLPIAAPGLAAGAIYSFLLSWNEFVFSYFITATSVSSEVPLPVYLKTLLGSFSPNLVSISTLSLLVSIPVIIFTFIVQKYMIAGMIKGAVK